MVIIFLSETIFANSFSGVKPRRCLSEVEWLESNLYPSGGLETEWSVDVSASIVITPFSSSEPTVSAFNDFLNLIISSLVFGGSWECCRSNPPSVSTFEEGICGKNID